MTINKVKTSSPPHPIVAVGGLGGSGTRLLSLLFEKSGVSMGSCGNRGRDNTWFTLLFKEPGVLTLSDEELGARFAVLHKGMCGGTEFSKREIELIDRLSRLVISQRSPDMLDPARATLLAAVSSAAGAVVRWGWKEPNTHMVIERLLQQVPQLRYVHVTRNGLDMAHSANLHQLVFWQHKVLSESCEQLSKAALALAFWCKCQHRFSNVKERFARRILEVKFEDLCADPRVELENILNFSQLIPNQDVINCVAATIREPDSVGRYKQYGLSQFRAQDLDYVRALGYL